MIANVLKKFAIGILHLSVANYFIDSIERPKLTWETKRKRTPLQQKKSKSIRLLRSDNSLLQKCTIYDLLIIIDNYW